MEGGGVAWRGGTNGQILKLFMLVYAYYCK